MRVSKTIGGLFVVISCWCYPVAGVEVNEVVNEATIEKIAEKTAKILAEQIAQDQQNQRDKDADDAQQSKITVSEQLPAQSTQTKILRIGTGAIGGNYFVLGELVGGVVSHPMGSLDCGKGGTCGVPNLQAQNVTTAGSVANLDKLSKGQVKTAFVQSDIAYWAYTGSGLFENKEKISDIRAIASLYPEAMHIIVNKKADIHSIADMVGKRVSLGARKSGTLQGARLVLAAYKLSEDNMQTEYLNSTESIKKLVDDELDAVFFTVGAPAPTFERLFEQNDHFQLLSIDEAERQAIFSKGHYFSPYTIPANTYRNSEAIETISVYALWLANRQSDETLIYELTKSLWGDTAKQLFSSSHIGSQIDIENSLKGIGIPLHSGAKKYYNEIGKRF